MKGTKIDFNIWKRAEAFRNFMDSLRCTVSMTADVDVTSLIESCKETNLRFFPFLFICCIKGYKSPGRISHGV